MREKATTATTSDFTIQDDYDGWCENGSICGRNISQYITEVKGNAAYGNQYGAIGTYDAVLRVNLNGRQANGTVTIIWDSGPALNFNGSRYNCYQVGVTACGSHVVADRRVTSTSRRSSSGLIYGNYLANSADYYNAFDTNFVPDGYPQYDAAPINTYKFTCSSGATAACKYY